MNNCKECNYRFDPSGLGHCYMFKVEPKPCGQFRAKPYAKKYEPTIPDEPRTHSDGGGTDSSHSWLNTPTTQAHLTTPAVFLVAADLPEIGNERTNLSHIHCTI
mgnify:CR=1 FL=1